MLTQHTQTHNIGKRSKHRFTMDICFTQHTQTHNIGKRSKQQRRLSGSKKEWTLLNVAQPDGHDHLHCAHGHWHHHWLVPCYQDPQLAL